MSAQMSRRAILAGSAISAMPTTAKICCDAQHSSYERCGRV